MKVIVIGGTGHIGTYLVPELVQEGYEVISLSRQKRNPYQPNDAWKNVRQISIDRTEAEKDNTFGKFIRDLRPEVVIDLICFTTDSAKLLAESLKDHVRHFLHCGTIWVHGHSVMVPTSETQIRFPFGEYGIKKKEIEDYLLSQFQSAGFPITILHPGHIVGPGWIPINPAGNLNLEVFRSLATGNEVALPNLGMETLHHVHARDVARSFIDAIQHKDKAVGESFHIVSPQAMTMRGYAEAIAEWYGRRPNIHFLPWDKWQKTVSEGDARITWDHIAHSPNCSIDKARKLIEYNPVYSSLDAIKESLTWLIQNKML